jgi:hypothetical protein
LPKECVSTGISNIATWIVFHWLGGKAEEIGLNVGSDPGVVREQKNLGGRVVRKKILPQKLGKGKGKGNGHE